MTIRIPRSISLPPPSPFCNHRIGNSGVALYLNRCNSVLLHPSFLIFSTSFYFLQPSFMASRLVSSHRNTRVFIPSPLWWQPSARWVAISHLPVHLHNHSNLAPLVAHFGSLISFSYPANFSDKRIVLVLVGNCFITKVPHILPVREGERIFPVKIQVIFQTKISEEGIIFDPMDSGDGFCIFYSRGQCPSVTQQGATFPLVPITLSHVQARDKKKQPTSVSVGAMPPPLFYGSSAPSIVSHQRESTLVSSSRDLKLPDLASIEKSLNSAILKFNSGAAVPPFESDISCKVRSHQSPLSLLTSAVRNQSDSRSSLGQIEDKEKAQRTHLLDKGNMTDIHSSVRFDLSVPTDDQRLHKLGKSFLTDKFLGAADLLPAFTQNSFSTIEKLPSGIGVHDNLVDNDSIICIEPSQTLAVEPGLTLSNDKENLSKEKDTSIGWANPPIVFKRRRLSKLHGQGKADLTLPQNKPAQSNGIQTVLEQSDRTAIGSQEDRGQHGGKVLSNLGQLRGRK